MRVDRQIIRGRDCALSAGGIVAADKFPGVANCRAKEQYMSRTWNGLFWNGVRLCATAFGLGITMCRADAQVTKVGEAYQLRAKYTEGAKFAYT